MSSARARRERLLAPGMPVDGVVHVLAQVGAGLGGEAVRRMGGGVGHGAEGSGRGGGAPLRIAVSSRPHARRRPRDPAATARCAAAIRGCSRAPSRARAGRGRGRRRWCACSRRRARRSATATTRRARSSACASSAFGKDEPPASWLAERIAAARRAARVAIRCSRGTDARAPRERRGRRAARASSSTATPTSCVRARVDRRDGGAPRASVAALRRGAPARARWSRATTPPPRAARASRRARALLCGRAPPERPVAIRRARPRATRSTCCAARRPASISTSATRASLVQALAAGRRVLDLFAYTGGFAVAAARGGAAAVTLVDSSEAALALARATRRAQPPRAGAAPRASCTPTPSRSCARPRRALRPPGRRPAAAGAPQRRRDARLARLQGRPAPRAARAAPGRLAARLPLLAPRRRPSCCARSPSAPRSTRDAPLQVLRELGAPSDHPVSLDHPGGRLPERSAAPRMSARAGGRIVGAAARRARAATLPRGARRRARGAATSARCSGERRGARRSAPTPPTRQDARGAFAPLLAGDAPGPGVASTADALGWLVALGVTEGASVERAAAFLVARAGAPTAAGATRRRPATRRASRSRPRCSRLLARCPRRASRRCAVRPRTSPRAGRASASRAASYAAIAGYLARLRRASPPSSTSPTRRSSGAGASSSAASAPAPSTRSQRGARLRAAATPRRCRARGSARAEVARALLAAAGRGRRLRRRGAGRVRATCQAALALRRLRSRARAEAALACARPMLNLAALHEAIAAAIPERECLVFRDRRLTWAEVTDRTRRLADVLRRHGLGCRRERAGLAGHESGQDHVALYLYNGNEYLEGMLGAFKARAVPFNVNYRYVDEELLYLFRDAEARAVIYHARFAPVLARIRAQLPQVAALAAGRRRVRRAAAAGRARLRGGARRGGAGAAAGPLARRSLHPLHRRHDGHAEGRALAPGGHLPRRARAARRAAPRLEALVARARARPGPRALPAPPFMHGAAHWVAFSMWHVGGTIVVQSQPERLDAGRHLVDRRARARRGAHDRRRRLRAARCSTRCAEKPLRPLVAAPAHLGRRHPHRAHRKAELLRAAAGRAHPRHARLVGERPAGVPGVARRRRRHDRRLRARRRQRRARRRSRRRARAGERRARAGSRGAATCRSATTAIAEKTARTFPVVDGVRYAVPGDRADRRGRTARLRLLGRDARHHQHRRREDLRRGGGARAEAPPRRARRGGRRHAPRALRPAGDRAGRSSAPGARRDEDALRAAVREHLARLQGAARASCSWPQLVRAPSGKADYRWAAGVAQRGAQLSSAFRKARMRARVDAEVALAVARLRAHVDDAAAARRAHAHDDVVDEAEQARGLARLERAVAAIALRRTHLGHLPAEALGGAPRALQGLAGGHRERDRREVGIAGALLRGERRRGSPCRGPRSSDPRARARRPADRPGWW